MPKENNTKDFHDDYSEEKTEFEKKFALFADMISHSRRMTVLTGAGVSTLSGIPDFRGAHGVYTDPWAGISVEEIISMTFFRKNPDIFYKWACDVWYRLDEYEPNIVHRAIAALEDAGKIQGVFTQNIDMLHQKAGSRHVWELHGSPEKHYCMKCGAEYSYAEIAPVVKRGETPHCRHCGGIVKPRIVFYEEALPSGVVSAADKAFRETDLCVVFGSSLSVYPVAYYPAMAKSNGARVVFVNAQNAYNYADGFFDLLFRDLRQTSEALLRVFGKDGTGPREGRLGK